MKETLITKVNEFKKTNRPYGYPAIEVDKFLDELLVMLGAGNAENTGSVIDKNADKKQLFDEEYKTYGNTIIKMISGVRFTQGFKGYDTADVDDLLDKMVKIIKDNRAYEYINRSIDVNQIYDAKLRSGFRGYDSQEVDEFLDRIAREFKRLNGIKEKYNA